MHTEPDPAALGRLLGWKGPARGGGLVYPFFDPDGRPAGYARVKPDRPLPDRTKPGKVRKYEAPKGKPNRLYLPPLTRTVPADPTARLVVTEGLKQPLAADAGFPCVGLAGAWCGLPNGPRRRR